MTKQSQWLCSNTGVSCIFSEGADVALLQASYRAYANNLAKEKQGSITGSNLDKVSCHLYYLV